MHGSVRPCKPPGIPMMHLEIKVQVHALLEGVSNSRQQKDR